ncbi:MAG: CoB--CoM heterodisulfide reductase iron-sulfur subunit A family protein, partial [Candidatus Altiarchaeota archaeon]|nr:CoB--CoM heterodisulfide reductase iron-sulfur subunit A family protein [Candidatus Altiarchaeota archaeon]
MGKPRVGVFVCDCGLNIAAVVDCKSVTKYASKLDDVVVALENKYTCADSGQEEIKKAIKEHNLNRVVVASCSPRLHEPTFRKCIESAGLNRYLFEMANIREHCSWVHEDKEKATKKAMDLVAMAVAKARNLEPLPTIRSPVTNKALVVGGGVAGIQSALDLADMGFKTYLVEKEPSIGGHMAMLDKTFPTIDCSICILGPKMSDVGNHENIELLTYSEIEGIEGYIGNFKVKVRKKARYTTDECNGCGECWKVCPVITKNEFDLGLGPRKACYIPFPQAVPLKATIDREACIECGLCEVVCEREGAIDFDQVDEFVDIDVGTIIVATGFDDYDAHGRYGYGVFDNVLSGIDFERLINASGPVQGKFTKKDGSKPESMAFIQCVGSRDKEHPYCSNVCCMYAMKQATQIKEKFPDCEIYIFYIDIRAFGKDYEEFYERLRGKGVKFVRGRPSDVKEGEDGNLVLRVDDTLLNEI